LRSAPERGQYGDALSLNLSSNIEARTVLKASAANSKQYRMTQIQMTKTSFEVLGCLDIGFVCDLDIRICG
jgi:hypothetical protein